MTNLTITTAIKLSKKKKADIEEKLEKKYHQFSAVYNVNTAIIGGIIIFDGDKVYDGSIRTQLNIAKERLSN